MSSLFDKFYEKKILLEVDFKDSKMMDDQGFKFFYSDLVQAGGLNWIVTLEYQNSDRTDNVPFLVAYLEGLKGIFYAREHNMEPSPCAYEECKFAEDYKWKAKAFCTFRLIPRDNEDDFLVLQVIEKKTEEKVEYSSDMAKRGYGITFCSWSTLSKYVVDGKFAMEVMLRVDPESVVDNLPLCLIEKEAKIAELEHALHLSQQKMGFLPQTHEYQHEHLQHDTTIDNTQFHSSSSQEDPTSPTTEKSLHLPALDSTWIEGSHTDERDAHIQELDSQVEQLKETIKELEYEPVYIRLQLKTTQLREIEAAYERLLGYKKQADQKHGESHAKDAAKIKGLEKELKEIRAKLKEMKRSDASLRQQIDALNKNDFESKKKDAEELESKLAEFNQTVADYAAQVKELNAQLISSDNEKSELQIKNDWLTEEVEERKRLMEKTTDDYGDCDLKWSQKRPHAISLNSRSEIGEDDTRDEDLDAPPSKKKTKGEDL